MPKLMSTTTATLRVHLAGETKPSETRSLTYEVDVSDVDERVMFPRRAGSLPKIRPVRTLTASFSTGAPDLHVTLLGAKPDEVKRLEGTLPFWVSCVLRDTLPQILTYTSEGA